MDKMPQPKSKKVGRPKLAKGKAKGKIVPVRFNADELRRATLAAKLSQQTLSEWIRSLVHTSTVLE
jgi:hypothetical protein